MKPVKYQIPKELDEFLPKEQRLFLEKDLLKGEEKEHFIEVLEKLKNIVTEMPKTYQQDGLGYNSIAFLHYFIGGSDWYITERDIEEEQIQAYGYFIHGKQKEFGYIDLQIVTTFAELDFYFTPKPVYQILGKNDSFVNEKYEKKWLKWVKVAKKYGFEMDLSEIENEIPELLLKELELIKVVNNSILDKKTDLLGEPKKPFMYLAISKELDLLEYVKKASDVELLVLFNPDSKPGNTTRLNASNIQFKNDFTTEARDYDEFYFLQIFDKNDNVLWQKKIYKVDKNYKKIDYDYKNDYFPHGKLSDYLCKRERVYLIKTALYKSFSNEFNPNGEFAKAILEKRISIEDAIKIIKSANLEVPKEIFDLKINHNKNSEIKSNIKQLFETGTIPKTPNEWRLKLKSIINLKFGIEEFDIYTKGKSLKKGMFVQAKYLPFVHSFIIDINKNDITTITPSNDGWRKHIFNKKTDFIPYSEMVGKPLSNLYEFWFEIFGLDGYPKKNLGSLEGEYFPKSKAKSLQVETPDSQDEEIKKTMDKLVSEVGDIDNYVMLKLGYKSKDELYKHLGAEQIDGIALAVYNIENKNQGVIVADQTGIGKGRLCAGILRYAKQIGKVPVFLTIRANLFSDIFRDLHDIGCDNLTPVKKIVKTQSKDENGKPLFDENGKPVMEMVVTRRKKVDKDTGEVTYTETPKYEYVTDYKPTKQFRPFILNSQSSDNSPDIRDFNGNIVYQVLANTDEQRKNELTKVVKNFDLSGYDCVLATYSQFSDKPSNLSKNEKLIIGGRYNFNSEKQLFLDKLIEDNIVILDEAHEAGGEGNVGVFMNQIIGKAKGVVYSSATYAKFAKNMPIYMHKTAIKDTGLSLNQFVDAISNGGFALQEILSANLVESGNLIRRERPLGNIKFNYIIADASGERQYGIKNREIFHYDIFDKIANILRNTIKFQKTYVDEHIRNLDENAKAVYEKVHGTRNSNLGFNNTPAFSKLFQIINQTLFSLKAEDIALRAIQRLRQGQKVVITFENTMEKFINAFGDLNQTIDTDFSIVLKNGLRQTLLYNEYDENGNIKTDAQGNEIGRKIIDIAELSQSAQDKYYQIADEIHKISIGIHISPIDVIKQTIEKAGYKVGELTGRKTQVRLLPNNKGKIVSRKVENVTETANKFNKNEIDCILINESGATGISLHAKPNEVAHKFSKQIPTSLEPRNEVKQRVMIVAQPTLDVNTQMQMFGRINRSGQVYSPEYDIMSLAVPAEKRLLLMLQRKLRSLDSNTTANQKQNEKILNNVDFLNKFGDNVVDEWLESNSYIKEELDYPNYIKFSKRVSGQWITEYEHEPANCSQKTSGRIAIMPVAEQKRFYDEVNDRYIDYIKKLEDEGQNTLEVKELPLEAKVLFSHKASEGLETNPFNSAYYINECEVNNLQKPMTKPEIQKAVEDYLNGEKSLDNKDRLEKEFLLYLQNKRNSDNKSYNERFEEDVKRIKEMPSLLKIKEEEGMEAYRQALQKKINEAQVERDEKIDKNNSQLDELKNDLLTYFNFFTVGKIYSYPNIIESTDAKGNIIRNSTHCVFLGYKIDTTKSNPYARSNISMFFACANGFRRRELILSRHSDKMELVSIMNEDRSRYESYNYNAHWEILTKDSSKAREKRYIVTGNILQALKEMQGQLISFTYSDGSKGKGIFMPKNYKPDLSAQVDIIFMEKLLLKMTANDEYSSDTNFGTEKRENDGISFKDNGGLGFQVILGKSAKDAAKFYKDIDLIEFLHDKQFTQQGSGKNWVGFLSRNNLYSFLDVLQKKHGIKMKISPQDYELIKDDIEKARIRQKQLETTGKLIRLEIKHYKLNKYKQVAGLGNMKTNNDIDQIVNEFWEKVRTGEIKDIRETTKENLQGLSEQELDKEAEKLGIDFSKIIHSKTN